MMDKEEWIEYTMEKQGKSRAEALTEYDKAEKGAVVSDNNGKNGAKRIPCKIEDFIIGKLRM